MVFQSGEAGRREIGGVCSCLVATVSGYGGVLAILDLSLDLGASGRGTRGVVGRGGRTSRDAEVGTYVSVLLHTYIYA